MKRKIVVSTAEQALQLMKAFLFSNRLSGKLDLFDHENQKACTQIKLGWFSRDMEDDDSVGCPCFVCDFAGTAPYGRKPLKGIVYVKVFASKDVNITKILVTGKRERIFFDEIPDGEIFYMKDPLGRYEPQSFIYKDGAVAEM